MAFPLLSLGLLTLTTKVQSVGGHAIVPGKSLGSISLGMAEEDVRKKLKTPAEFVQGPEGTLMEVWYGKTKLSGTGDDSFLRRNYVAIYFKDEKVVQIEATSKSFKTSSGLSTGSAVKLWQAQFKFRTDKNDLVVNLDPDGLPAMKHLRFYGDAIAQGLAWKQGAWGNLFPEPGPEDGLESVIVHLPGTAVLLNPQDNKPYSGTPAG